MVSREIVRLHAKFYGRGPTKARTFLGPDFSLTILEDVFTPSERTLIRAGKSEHVNATRAAFQDAMSGEFTHAIEQATGRRVRAFLSQIHLEPEIAVELFLFEPEEIAEDGRTADAGQDGHRPDG